MPGRRFMTPLPVALSSLVRTSSRRSTIRPRVEEEVDAGAGAAVAVVLGKVERLRGGAGGGGAGYRQYAPSVGRRGSLRLYRRKTRCNACRHIAARRRGRRYTAYRRGEEGVTPAGPVGREGGRRLVVACRGDGQRPAIGRGGIEIQFDKAAYIGAERVRLQVDPCVIPERDRVRRGIVVFKG